MIVLHIHPKFSEPTSLHVSILDEFLRFICLLVCLFSDFHFNFYRFLGYEFSTYGLSVLGYSEMDAGSRPDPMAVVFPKVSKCTFHKYGPSGTVERHDGLCVLPLNIINEKIYVFLWFWFVFLSIVTAIQVLII